MRAWVTAPYSVRSRPMRVPFVNLTAVIMFLFGSGSTMGARRVIS